MLGNKIQRARKALGFSLRDLAESLSLSHTAIKKYEDNQVIPSSALLIQLAKALQVKVEYFFREEALPLEQIQYRKHVDMPKRQLTEITAKIMDQIERRVMLEDLFPISPIQKFSITPQKISHYADIEEIALGIRKQFKLGLEPLPHLIDIFEENGIKIFEIDNQRYPKFDGLSATINEMPLIVIGNQWPGDRQRFTLAHELGHLVFSDFAQKTLDEEKCCDRFAGAFLLPKPALLMLWGQHRHAIELRELDLLKKEFGISMMRILHRAEEVGIIKNSVYQAWRADFERHGWSKQEPGDPYPPQPTYLFEQLVFRALSESYIGESKAAELMNVSISQFRATRHMEYSGVIAHQ